MKYIWALICSVWRRFTRRSRLRKVQNIIGLLTQEYSLKNRATVDRQISQIARDFQLRGMSISSARVANQMRIEFDYVDALVEHVVTGLTNQMPFILLKDCQEYFFEIIEQEYKRIALKVNQWHVQMPIGGFQNRVANEMSLAKERIRVKCELFQPQKTADTINMKAAQIGLLAALIGLLATVIATAPWWWPMLNKTTLDAPRLPQVNDTTIQSVNSPPPVGQSSR
jgi:hypothetical protein